MTVANGDKSVFFDDNRGFCLYRTIGPYLVVFSDPVVRSAADRMAFLDALFTMAGELGIPVVERRITRDEFYIADEAFFTGTAAEVTPVREVDGRIIGPGTPGPVTKKLQAAFFAVVKGQDPNYQHWLTYI